MQLDRVVLLLAAALAVTLTRPDSSAFPAWVERRRAKRPSKTGWRDELAPVVEALKERDGTRAWTAVRRKVTWNVTVSADETWAVDAVFLSYGCARSRKGRQSCFVGAAGDWHKVPSWTPSWDRYLLVALHALACACANFDPASYFRNFEPRASQPRSVLLGAFGTSQPLHMMWLAATILGVGADVQREIGRMRFVGLYVAAGLASSFCSMLFRASASGAGGALACYTFHVLAAPHTQHSIFGVTMSARVALAVQLIIACSPAIGQPWHRARKLLLINLVPTAIGAQTYFATQPR